MAEQRLKFEVIISDNQVELEFRPNADRIDRYNIPVGRRDTAEEFAALTSEVIAIIIRKWILN